MSKSFKHWLVGIVTFALMVGSMKVLYRTWDMALVITTSVALHELGHWAAMSWYRVSSHIVFVPFLGAATVYQQGGPKMRHFSDSIVALSGPFVNVCLIILAALLPRSYWTGLILQANAMLAVFNLLPIFSGLDGGRFVRSVYASLNEWDDRTAAIILSVFMLVLSVAALIQKGLIFVFPLALINVVKGSQSDDPREAFTPFAMPWIQVFEFLFLYALMTAIAIVAYIKF